MNHIKTTIVWVAFASFVIAGATSCSDFLDEKPKTALTSEQVYTQLTVLEPTVDGLYTSFRKSKEGRAGFTFTLLGMDDVKQGIVQMTDASQSGLDYYDGMLNGTSSQISEMWYKRWPMINTAALSIRGLELLSESETKAENLEKIKLLRANACFIRALAVFELTMYWGEVPVIEIVDLDNPEINMSRRPLETVWKQIFDDLTYASENLDSGRQTGPRATKGAAIAMLGKLHLYAPVESGYRDFSKAIDYFEKIKNNYSLESSYEKMFDEYATLEFNSNESIFEIDYICNSSGPNYWQWDMGSRTLANLGESCYIGGYDVALPTEYAHKMKSAGGVWEDGDLRRDASIRFDFTYRDQEFTVPSWGADELDPHIKKWEDRRLDKWTSNSLAAEATSGRSIYWSGKNYMYLRYGDILLCYAECLNETGRTGEAVEIANQVRARAWGGSLPANRQWAGLSQEQFRTDMLDERLRELCFEGWRRMDLIRTGKFVELIKERNSWAKSKGAIRDFHVRWPIPEDEIKNNSYMEMGVDQNPGY